MHSWWIVFVVLGTISPGPAQAGDDWIQPTVSSRATRPRAVAAKATLRQRTDPLVSPTVPFAVARKLEQAYSLALARVEGVPSCRSMFARLGADGVETLSRILYLPACRANESRICGRSTRAFTEVGSSIVKLCQEFERLSEDQAAVILLHEALHTAGLSERPRDPDAMSPAEINAMVERSCGLGR